MDVSEDILMLRYIYIIDKLYWSEGVVFYVAKLGDLFFSRKVEEFTMKGKRSRS
jgi:hypothetical protein